MGEESLHSPGSRQLKRSAVSTLHLYHLESAFETAFPISINMMLLSVLTLILPLTVAIAIPAEMSENPTSVLERDFSLHKCAIVGSGPAYCRSCDSASCQSLYTLQVGQVYNYDCVCRGGQCVSGDCGWDYNVDLRCFVWEARTDNNCPPTGTNALTTCAFCSDF